MSIKLFGEPDSDHYGDAMHDYYTRDDGDFADATPRRTATSWPCGCAFKAEDRICYVHRCDTALSALTDEGENHE